MTYGWTPSTFCWLPSSFDCVWRPMSTVAISLFSCARFLMSSRPTIGSPVPVSSSGPKTWTLIMNILFWQLCVPKTIPPPRLGNMQSYHITGKNTIIIIYIFIYHFHIIFTYLLFIGVKKQLINIDLNTYTNTQIYYHIFIIFLFYYILYSLFTYLLILLIT